MLIAFDGGAFQQGIAAGIFNVAVGYLNASVAVDPSVQYVLVADPRLGPVKEELIGYLSVRPQVVYSEVGPAYFSKPTGLLTGDPKIQFSVDGRLTSAAIKNEAVTYRGPAPRKSFTLESRAVRPSDIGISPDHRLLGIAVKKVGISIEETGSVVVAQFSDSRLNNGSHAPESTFRWTNGALELPMSLFYGARGEVVVRVEIGHTLTYPIAGGAYDAIYKDMSVRLQDLELNLNIARLGGLLRNMGVTAYFCSHFIPAIIPGMKTFAWAFDIIPVLYPQFFMKDAIANFDENIAVFRNADAIFSISDATRDDLIQHLDVVPERVTSVGIAGRDLLHLTEPQATETIQRYSLESRKYIICVGTLEPRKNHLGLLRAYAAFSAKNAEAPVLVIVGRYGWGHEKILQEIERLGIQDRVNILNNVSDAELEALYSGALYAVYVSLYEGFGLPVLEAMSLGTPVITSNLSSMAEIAGDAALLVDPTDSRAISKAMFDLWSDSQLRAQFSGLGIEQSAKYSWRATAETVLSVIKGL